MHGTWFCNYLFVQFVITLVHVRATKEDFHRLGLIVRIGSKSECRGSVQLEIAELLIMYFPVSYKGRKSSAFSSVW